MSSDKLRAGLANEAPRRTFLKYAGMSVAGASLLSASAAAETTDNANGSFSQSRVGEHHGSEPKYGEGPAPSQAKTEKLIRSWLDLWNGDYTQASKIVAPNFRLHAALIDGSDDGAINSPQALTSWIKQIRAPIPDLRFSVQVGPIVDGNYIVVRWRAQGTYAGGMPDATAPVGAPVDFTGTDILRVAHGQLAEYWVNSDTHLLLTQLQVETN